MFLLDLLAGYHGKDRHCEEQRDRGNLTIITSFLKMATH